MLTSYDRVSPEELFDPVRWWPVSSGAVQFDPVGWQLRSTDQTVRHSEPGPKHTHTHHPTSAFKRSTIIVRYLLCRDLDVPLLSATDQWLVVGKKQNTVIVIIILYLADSFNNPELS